MRLVYLCTADPPPPNSDFPVVLSFFESLPEYLHPRSKDNTSPHMLYFADRIGGNWQPEFHDFAIAFISEHFLRDTKAINCLSRAYTAFPNLICIDLYNNLTPDLLAIAQNYSKRIFSPSEGKEFLLTTFPEIAAAYDLETKQLTHSIEKEGYEYLSQTIVSLKHQERTNRILSFFCYIISSISLIAMIIFIFWRFCIFSQTELSFGTEKVIIICVEAIILSALSVSVSRFFFLLENPLW